MDIKVTFRYKRAIDPGDRESLYIYNLIFKKIMKTLKFVESAKKANYFDPKGGKEIKVRYFQPFYQNYNIYIYLHMLNRQAIPNSSSFIWGSEAFLAKS